MRRTWDIELIFPIKDAASAALMVIKVLSLVSPHHDCVNRFLTIGWRGQAQFGTLTHLVFSGTAHSQHHIRFERGGRLGRRMGRRGLANLEREIESLCCRPRGKRH